AARASHRTVRNRALAPLSQRVVVPGKYPGSQKRRRNLAEPRNPRGIAGQFRRRYLLAERPETAAAAPQSAVGVLCPAAAAARRGSTCAGDRRSADRAADAR